METIYERINKGIDDYLLHNFFPDETPFDETREISLGFDDVEVDIELNLSGAYRKEGDGYNYPIEEHGTINIEVLSIDACDYEGNEIKLDSSEIIKSIQY